MDITLKDFQEGQVIDFIGSLVKEQMGDRFDKAIRGAIKEALEERIATTVAESLSTAVQEVLAAGWRPTDQWGQPKGEPVTLRGRVELAITEFMEKRDSYSRESPMQKLINEHISAAVNTELKEVFAKAKVSLQAQVDDVIQAKLAATLKSALGLR